MRTKGTILVPSGRVGAKLWDTEEMQVRHPSMTAGGKLHILDKEDIYNALKWNASSWNQMRQKQRN